MQSVGDLQEGVPPFEDSLPWGAFVCLPQPMSYPLRHVSIRVPWHDSAWSGRVCAAPAANDACLVLSRIRQRRDDAHEAQHAGEDWAQLPLTGLPPCVRERAGFMRPTEFSMAINHPYEGRSPTSRGLGTATLRVSCLLCAVHPLSLDAARTCRRGRR